MMIVAAAGLVMNGVIAALLWKVAHDVNIRSVFLHMLGDTLSTAAVIGRPGHRCYWEKLDRSRTFYRDRGAHPVDFAFHRERDVEYFAGGHSARRFAAGDPLEARSHSRRAGCP